MLSDLSRIPGIPRKQPSRQPCIEGSDEAGHKDANRPASDSQMRSLSESSSQPQSESVTHSLCGTPSESESESPFNAIESVSKLEIDGSLLKRPTTAAMNSFEDKAETQTLGWAVRFRLLRDQHACHVLLKPWSTSKLAAFLYPKFTKKQLEMATDFVTTLFLFNDLVDVSSANGSHSEEDLRMLESRIAISSFGGAPQRNDHPVALAYAELYQRALALSKHVSWVASYAASIREYILGCRWERAGRLREGPPSLSTYLMVRQLTSAVYPCIAILGMFLDGGRDASLYDCPFIRRLMTMTVNHMAWVNDIFSVKTKVRDGVKDNLVVVLQQEKDLSWPEALDEAIEMCNSEVESFLDLEEKLEQLRGPSNEDVVQFINGLKEMMAGHIEWYKYTLRYS